MSVQCSKQDCRANSTHRLEFRLVLQDGAEVPAAAGLYLCRAHASEEAAAEVLAYEPGRAQIERAFAAQGLALPDWPQCRAVWISLPRLH